MPFPWTKDANGSSANAVLNGDVMGYPAGLAHFADTFSQPAAIGRLGEVCDRWIYTACLCFGLDPADQELVPVPPQLRHLPGRVQPQPVVPLRAQMQATFGIIVDRARRRVNVPALRTLFGKQRPRTNRSDLSPRVAAVTETPKYGLTIVKVHVGALTLKGYIKGEHVLRLDLEAIAHTKARGTGRVLDRFPEIVDRLAGMLELLYPGSTLAKDPHPPV